MAYEYILSETRGRVGLVTLNRPKALNALNEDLMTEVLDAFLKFDADDGIGAIVITGSEKAFAAGADIGGMKDWNFMDVYRSDFITRNWDRVKLVRKPIIAAVNGAAYAGGMEMALCADFIYAVDTARFALTEVTLGIMPGAGGTQNLPRAVGSRRAKEILLTGKPFSVQDAYDWGMVNRICKPETLLAEALETASVIAGNAPISTRQIKQSVNMGQNMDLQSAMMFEIEAYNRMVPTEDRREGILAFNEKRKPVYLGR